MRRISNSALVIVFAAVIVTLLVLAVLQYRWINEASATGQRRMEETLRTAMARFSEDLHGELTGLASTFAMRDLRSDEQIAQTCAERLQQWSSASRFPDLLKDVLLARIEAVKQVTLLRCDPRSRLIERVEWPDELNAFHEHAIAESVRVMAREAFRGPPSREPPVSHVPAVAGPVFDGGELRGWQIIRIDPEPLKRQVLPELAATHFPRGNDVSYDVLITEARDGTVLFASPPDLRTSAFDAQSSILISSQILGGPPRGPRRPPPGVMPDGMPPPPPRGGMRGDRGMGPPRDGPADSGGWRLYARYEGGSVESVVNNVRRTNLAVSFGLLVVLAGVIAFTLLYTERVRALGKMQMEFAAGLSHELRTPLTAIRSAAYNMIAGNVSSKEDVVKYGSLLQDEGLRLSEMVEQALTFAQSQSGKLQYTILPTDVAAVVSNTVSSFRSLRPASPCNIVTKIQEDLPLGMTDAGALVLCLQNLLANAVKYGSTGQAVRVDARAGDRRNQIQISVADQGPGIDRSDLPHIFEPFFRGRNAGSAHGNGLGLYLVKRAIESVGGRVDVASSEKGSRFTLFIPSLQDDTDVQ